MNFYTGVGSRSAPQEILSIMEDIGYILGNNKWILRSGGAQGSDSAFEAGCDKSGYLKEIYLPWKKFNKSESTLYKLPSQAFDIAQRIHPAWNKCDHAAKKLHARNVLQVLGLDLNTPSKFLICWTLEGKETGGTRTAIILAKQENIPICNLAINDHSKFLTRFI